MSKIIPTISSGIAGPLGILHLPRLWQKSSLEAAGKLHADYPGCGQGYDSMVLDALEIDRDTYLEFIQKAKPTYIQLEQWILEQKNGSLDTEKIHELNQAIINYHHDDETRGTILSSVGIADTGAILDAINLNNLDDWQGFHQNEIA